jgi:predicted  nucleic acid-binding Zn-ribbon protein
VKALQAVRDDAEKKVKDGEQTLDKVQDELKKLERRVGEGENELDTLKAAHSRLNEQFTNQKQALEQKTAELQGQMNILKRFLKF